MNTEDPRLEWIRAYADGSADEATTRSLEQALREDSGFRDVFLDYLNVDDTLAIRGLACAGVAAFRADEARKRRPRWLWAGAGGLAVAAMAGVLLLLLPATPCAELTDTRGARWEACTLPTTAGSRLTTGTLRLVDGLAQLRFADGADVALEGPAELDILGPGLCRVRRGSVVFHVPAAARGFTVVTQHASLVAQGSDYGLSSEANGQAKIHVMQGKVEVHPLDGRPVLRLGSREMAAITAEKILPSPLEPEPGLTSDSSTGSDALTVLTTRAGRGAAAYVAESTKTRHVSDQLLLLKHCAEPGYGRKICLRFDLAALSGPTAEGAGTLQLHLAPTGYGYAARAGDAHIVVYAVTDDSADLWDPAGLTWANQPAFHPSAGQVAPDHAIRLGETNIPRGIQSGPVSIPLPGLAALLRQDRNQLLTLIVVRENPTEQEGGLVLGFAGNQHPLLPPPTLRLR